MSQQEMEERRVVALSRRLDTMEERLQSVEAENQLLKSRLNDAESEIASLRERTELVDHIQDASALAPEQRAAALIQTLHNEAEQRAQKNTKDAPTASMDVEAAKKALGGGIDRSGIYYTFEKADELVDSRAVRYVKEPRSADVNSRLVLDLKAGPIPSTIAGQHVGGGV